MTPLLASAAACFPEGTQLLIEAQADVAATDHGKATALHHACHAGTAACAHGRSPLPTAESPSPALSPT